ncbi:MAG: hypothetical protein QM775_23140 [Pirellulales bacterium]
MTKKSISAEPPQSKGPGYRLRESAGELELSFRTRQYGVAGFIAFFLCGWSAGCAFLIYRLSQDPKPEHVLFAVPFLVGWLFAFLVLINMVFARETLRLSSDGARFAHWLFFEYGVVQMPLDELLGCGTANNSDGDGEQEAVRVLEVRTIGRPIRFGASVGPHDRVLLSGYVDQRLRALQKLESRPPRLHSDRKPRAYGQRLAGELLSEVETIRTPSDLPIDPPADMRWRAHSDFDVVTFTHPGQWTTGGVIGLLMINLFWSVITGFFWYQLFGGDPTHEYVGLEFVERFIFLLPFTVVGLAMFLGLLVVMLEPVRRYRWRFTRDEATCKLSWFGIGKTWRIPLVGVDGIEVRYVPYQPVKRFHRLPLGTIWTPQGCPTFTVALVNAAKLDLCKVEGLTLGEAHYLADTLVRSQIRWFF